MADHEGRLIAAVVAESNLQPLLETKVTPEFFADPEHREVYDWLLQYWGRYGKVPGPKAIKGEFPTYRLVKGGEPYEFYLDEVRRRRRWGLLMEAIGEASDALEEFDADEAKDLLQQGLLRVDTEVSELRDTNIIETWERRLDTYREWRKRGDSLRGIPSGFPTIDAALRGFQEQQLITFVGVPKAGKSTMLMRMAIAAHSAGRTPLFLGFEMSNEEQEARHDSMQAEVSYPRLLSGNLTDEEMEDVLAKRLYRMRRDHPFVLSSDVTSGATVSGIGGKIEQYKPDIVFIDGVYMMDDEAGEPKGSAQALTNITRALKRLAQNRDIPIVISTQVLTWKLNRKKGVDMNSIGYSSSFSQDSDVILAVEHSDEDEESPIKRVKIVQARSAPKREVLIAWDWEHGTFTELTEEEAAGGYGTDLEDDEEIDPEEIEEDTWDRKRKVVVRKKKA